MKRYDFSSLAAFADACEALPADIQAHRSKSDWTGETWAQSMHYIRSGGSAKYVPAAEALVGQIQAALPETATRRWELAHAGAFPCVPAFLAGEPENMWTVADAQTDTAPVRIYFSADSSGGIDADKIAARGAAVLSLVMLVSRTRPVELYAFTITGDRHGRRDVGVVTRLQSHPLMVSEVAYCLSSAAFERNLAYGFLQDKIRYTTITWSPCQIADDHHAGPATRRALGLEPQDVLIGPVHVRDPLLTDPIGFVNRELSKLGLTGE